MGGLLQARGGASGRWYAAAPVDPESAIFEWQEGQRRADASPPAERAALERVVAAVVVELRRRLGGPFSTAELAELYAAGTDWCLETAVRVAPDRPGAWDAQTIAGAAFSRYVREAADFAGGRLLAR